MHRYFLIFFTGFLLFLASPALTQQAIAGRQQAIVKEVLSGDTVRLQGGRLLKYASLKAPALQSRVIAVRTYGENSLAFNKQLVEGKTIWIEWGAKLRDSKGHLLGYVFLEDGTFVNEEILKNGHAKIFVQAPNLKYTDKLRDADLKARRARAGVWVEEAKDPFKQVKYIGEKSTKIYYLPSSPELDRIPEAHRITFNSRVDAKAAGYKPCFNCREDKEPDFE